MAIIDETSSAVNSNSNVRYSSRTHPCRICGRTKDRDCHEFNRNGVVCYLCHTGRGRDYGASGYVYMKDSSCGTWGVYFREEDCQRRCTGGTEYLIDHLRQLPAERRRDLVVIREHDRNERQGTWPGRSGAYRTTKRLADELSVPVRVAFPPDGHKDSRDWLKVQLAAGRSLEWCRTEWAAHCWFDADTQEPEQALRFQDIPTPSQQFMALVAAAMTSGQIRQDDLSDFANVGEAVRQANVASISAKPYPW